MTHIDLSILLPSYNNVCVSLVQALQRQADALRGKLDKPFRYEIIVADDCSTDAACIDANRVIGDMLHCRYLRMEQNVGRAQIRNVLISEAVVIMCYLLTATFSCVMTIISTNMLHQPPMLFMVERV